MKIRTIGGRFRDVVIHMVDNNARTPELLTTDNPHAKIGAVTVDGPPSDGLPSHQFPDRINKSPNPGL